MRRFVILVLAGLLASPTAACTGDKPEKSAGQPSATASAAPSAPATSPAAAQPEASGLPGECWYPSEPGSPLQGSDLCAAGFVDDNDTQVIAGIFGADAKFGPVKAMLDTLGGTTRVRAWQGEGIIAFTEVGDDLDAQVAERLILLVGRAGYSTLYVVLTVEEPTLTSVPSALDRAKALGNFIGVLAAQAQDWAPGTSRKNVRTKHGTALVVAIGAPEGGGA